MNDFERLCAVWWAGVYPDRKPEMWSGLDCHKKLEERRGLLAVLREMREQGGFLLASSRATWQGRIDVLIAQAEASESEAAE